MRLIIIGGGGHARSVIDCIRSLGEHEIIGIAEAEAAQVGQQVDGIEIVCDDAGLDRFATVGDVGFVIGVGGIHDNGPRRQLFERTLAKGLRAATLIHPTAWIAESASLGPGTVALAGVIVNPGAKVGANVILNTGCVIEHDCQIGDHAHISTRATLAGGVAVGLAAHVGAGAVIRQYLSVGDEAVVGIGAVVTGDVHPGTVVVGNPARPMA